MADLSDDSGELIKRLIAEWFRRRLRELEHALKEGASTKLGLGDCVQLMRKWSASCPEDPYCVIGEKIGGKRLLQARRALREAGVDFKVAHAMGKEFLCVHQSDLRDAALAIERAGVVIKDVLDRKSLTIPCQSRSEATDLSVRLRTRPGAAFDAEVAEGEDGPCVIVRVAPERELEFQEARLEWERDLAQNSADKAKIDQMEKNRRGETREVDNLDALKATIPVAEQARGDALWRDLPAMQWVLERCRKAGIDDKRLAELSLGKNGEALDTALAAEAAKERGEGAPAQDKAREAARSGQARNQGKDGQQAARGENASEGPAQNAQQAAGGPAQTSRAAGDRVASGRQGPKHMAADKEAPATEQERGRGRDDGARQGQEATPGASHAPDVQATAPVAGRPEAARTHEVPAGFDKTVESLEEAAKASYTRIPRSESKSAFRAAPATEKQISSLAAAVRDGSVSMEEFNTLTADGTALPDRGAVTDLLEEVGHGERTDTGFRGAEPERESVDDMLSRAEGAASAERGLQGRDMAAREKTADAPSLDGR